MENLIYGKKPIFELFSNNPHALKKIYILKREAAAKVSEIENMCREKKIQFEIVEIEWFNKNLNNSLHQGIAALVENFKYHKLDEIISKKGITKHKLIVILDEIQDPQNLGSIIRSVEASGFANGIVLQKDRSARVSGAVYKSSAGALLYIPIALVGNISESLLKLKKEGFWIVGTDLLTQKKYYDFDFNCDIGLVIGSEGRGMRNLVKKNCDFLISIPMHGKTQSLNAGVAAGIILFHIAKLWNFG